MCRACKRLKDQGVKLSNHENYHKRKRLYAKEIPHLRKKQDKKRYAKNRKDLDSNHKCKVYFRKCTRCGKIDLLKAKSKRPVSLCSSCIREKKVVQKTCPCCKAKFTPNRPSTKYCSGSCAVRQSYLNYKRPKEHRTRCKEKNARFDFFVTRQSLRARDGDNCCKCSTPLKFSGNITDDYANLDHIIPISLGGNHTFSNLQLLCRKCNYKKRDKMPIVKHGVCQNRPALKPKRLWSRKISKEFIPHSIPTDF
jgi:5-methylcytosine-specific restriction endonuclease McrA